MQIKFNEQSGGTPGETGRVDGLTEWETSVPCVNGRAGGPDDGEGDEVDVRKRRYAG